MPTGRLEPEIIQIELISDLVKINNPHPNIVPPEQYDKQI